MLLAMEKRLREALSEHIATQHGIEVDVPIELPRQASHGDLATPVCFTLAKHLRRPPRQIAADLAAKIAPIEGIESLEAAGAGYINARLDRGAYAAQVMDGVEAAPAEAGKVIVEHTNINPNKAAHIGHLRNAVLGDTLVRLLRHLGRPVEVQNYIDNTGVQVADVVAAFHFLERMGPAEVRAMAVDPSVRFDHLCWDLYARISARFAAKDPEALAWRAETLRALEGGAGELAVLGGIVADAIVRCHLATMRRIGVAYDVLPRESEILKLRFWATAFKLLKARGVIRFESSGRNVGCWVMPASRFLAAAQTGKGSVAPAKEEVDPDKVIVRSNGTVTYVGKDIAYQLWKLGLLEGKDFEYRPFGGPENGGTWVTAADGGDPGAPSFGNGARVYNVIDVRQSYLQDVVREAVAALGYRSQADASVHFAYEMVALSPRCCAELGIDLSEQDRAKPYVEVSGRKGLGVKADDLLDLLVRSALDEVCSRHPESDDGERRRIAGQIAVGALRYFMLRFTRNTVIAFDFQEALSFEGETGPYLQYAAVRCRNILRKHRAAGGGSADPSRAELQRHLRDDRLWQLVLAMSMSRWTASRAMDAGEPAQLARSAFQAARAFNNFYHHTHILNEPDAGRKRVLLAIVQLALRELAELMGLMGMPVPARM